MAAGREYSNYQRKVIDRYYQHQDTILAQRLGDIASDMALASGDGKKLERLWKRAEQALARAKVNAAEVRVVLESRDPAKLASLISKL